MGKLREICTAQCFSQARVLTTRLLDCVPPAATGDMSAYQLHTPASSLPQGVGMAHLHGPQKPPEVITQKRELRLMKNR